MPDFERVHIQRSEEAYRAHPQEASPGQVLGQVPGRDGVRMTQAGGEGAVSADTRTSRRQVPSSYKVRLNGPVGNVRRGSPLFTIYDAKLDKSFS